MQYSNEEFSDAITSAIIALNMKRTLPYSLTDEDDPMSKKFDKLKVFLKPNFETACWTYAKDTHLIYVGDGIMDRVTEGYEDIENVVNKYIFHEAGHANFTTRNLNDLSKRLKKEKIDFQLFNLFEDAKIEHLMRLKSGLKFSWLEFDKIPKDTPNESPTTTFFKLIQTEGKGVFTVPYYESVKNYYDRTVKARTDDEMIKIMKDFLAEFPQAQKKMDKRMGQGQKGEEQDGQGQGQKGEEQEGEGEGQGQGQGQVSDFNEDEREVTDLSLGAKLAEDEFREKFENDCEIVFEDAESKQERLKEELAEIQDSKKSVKHLNEVKSGQIKNLQGANVDNMFNKNAEFNEKAILPEKIPPIEKKFKELLKSVDVLKLNSTKRGTKLNVPGVQSYLAGNSRAKYYKTDFEEDETFDKKNVTIVLDGSGSMSNKPIKNALTICVALNRLCNHGVFDGNIIGSKVKGRSAVNQGFKLPINDGMITSFRADAGAEGIGTALEKNMKVLNESDFVFVVTDGNIHDRDLEMLKNKHRKVYDKTVCIYIGSNKHTNEKDLQRWFKYSVVGKEIEDVVEKIAILIDPKSKKTALGEFQINSDVKVTVSPDADFDFGLNR